MWPRAAQACTSTRYASFVTTSEHRSKDGVTSLQHCLASRHSSAKAADSRPGTKWAESFRSANRTLRSSETGRLPGYASHVKTRRGENFSKRNRKGPLSFRRQDQTLFDRNCCLLPTAGRLRQNRLLQIMNVLCRGGEDYPLPRSPISNIFSG